VATVDDISVRLSNGDRSWLLSEDAGVDEDMNPGRDREPEPADPGRAPIERVVPRRRSGMRGLLDALMLAVERRGGGGGGAFFTLASSSLVVERLTGGAGRE
jgi:hypothetical protein